MQGRQRDIPSRLSQTFQPQHSRDKAPITKIQSLHPPCSSVPFFFDSFSLLRLVLLFKASQQLKKTQLHHNYPSFHLLFECLHVTNCKHQMCIFFPLPWWPGCFEHAVLMAVTALFSTVALPQPLTAYCMRCYDQKAQLHPRVPYGAQEHAHNPALATSQTITKKVSNRGSKKSPSNNRLEDWLHFLVRKVYLGGYY